MMSGAIARNEPRISAVDRNRLTVTNPHLTITGSVKLIFTFLLALKLLSAAWQQCHVTRTALQVQSWPNCAWH